MKMQGIFINKKTRFLLFLFLIGSLDLFAVKISLKVYLEGPFLNGLMNDDLRVKSLIPTFEPYDALLEFNHLGGGGTESIDSSILENIGNDAIVDWIFVELRDESNSSIVLFTRSALLQRDGDIVDIDGSSPLNFSTAPDGNYYISIRHRNHLSIITNVVYSLTDTSSNIDFTTSDTIAYGSNAQKNINNIWAMYSGDVDQSELINFQDRDLVWNDRSKTGYLSSDINMNGYLDASDRGLAWNNRNINAQYPPTTVDADITLTITFTTPPTIAPDVNFTRLRYNKDFAYSLTFDDGNAWEHNVSFPIIGGGTTPDGQTHAGQFYTDGCGNEQVFRAGISIMGNHIQDSSNGQDFMDWSQVQTLFDADWDIFSHSFDHCAYSGCDYDFEVLQNVTKIEEKLGFTVTHFSVPSGDDEGYTMPAFNNGMIAVYDQNWLFPGNGGLEVVDQMNLQQFRLHRNTLEFEQPPYGDDVDNVAALSQNGVNYWFSEYTHRVGYPGDSYAFVLADDFKAYMVYLENTYGRFGTDGIWFAPLQEVYEYIKVRDNAQILSSQIVNNQLIIKLDLSNIPSNLRRNSLSLLVDTTNTSTISNIETTDASLTFSADGLINLNW